MDPINSTLLIELGTRAFGQLRGEAVERMCIKRRLDLAGPLRLAGTLYNITLEAGGTVENATFKGLDPEGRYRFCKWVPTNPDDPKSKARTLKEYFLPIGTRFS